MEEFQAAEQRTDSEQAGHLVSLEEQLQAVRMKVCMRTKRMSVGNALRAKASALDMRSIYLRKIRYEFSVH